LLVVARDALAFLWLISAASLLLLRPSRATWAFFALSLYGWSPNNVVTMVGPAWLQVIATAFENIWEICIPFAGPVFALYLLQPDVMPLWRRNALRVVSALIASAVVFEITSMCLLLAGYAPIVYAHYTIANGLVLIATILTPAFLLATYYNTDRVTRSRLRWVLLGFGVGSAALIAALWFVGYSYILYSVGQAVYVFAITLSTGYAVLRHRIIDINVVVSRAVVYTLLSAFVVGLFALVDLFFSRTLSESKAGLMADVALALVLGFFLNSMHRQVDRFVDGILFRKRHIAERHIALVAESLRHTAHADRIDRMLIDEPVRSFDLVFGVLARRRGSALRVVYAYDKAVTEGTLLGNTEDLLSYLAAHRRALPLRYHYWHAPELRVSDVEPSIAVPIFSHDDLDAVVFFAPHRNGTELDGEEIALIDRVAEAAGTAYDRLEAAAMREKIERLGLTAAAP
jgi:hypothetical protein